MRKRPPEKVLVMVPSAPVALPPMTVMPLAAVVVPDFVRPPVPAMIELIESVPVVAHWLMMRSFVSAVIVPPVMTCALVSTAEPTKTPPAVIVRVLPDAMERVRAPAERKASVLTDCVVHAVELFAWTSTFVAAPGAVVPAIEAV